MASTSKPAGGFDSHTGFTAPRGRPLNQNSPWAQQNVLTFDGGGIRGYYSLLHLQYLMKCIKYIEENSNEDGGQNRDRGGISSFSPCGQPKDFSHSTSAESHFLPCHYFDYISGTSTGALITIMLTTLRMSVDDCLAEYERLAGEVFGHPRPIHHAGELGILVTKNKYATTNLENAIKDVMRRRGEVAHDHDDAMQFRTPKGLCRAMVFASRSANASVLQPLWIFRSYDNFPARDERPSGFPLNPGRGTYLAAWKVARAATAAPLYFKPLEIALDDGEVIRTRKQTTRLSQTLQDDGNEAGAARQKKKMQRRTRETVLLSDAGLSRANNPSMNVMNELKSIFRDGPKKVANWVSIGTARPIHTYGSSTLRPLLKKTISEAGYPEEEHQKMKDLAGEKNFDYYRLNEPNGLKNVEMDDWKPKRSNVDHPAGSETLEAMRNSFNGWVTDIENSEMMQKAASSLVQIRRARTAEYPRWERFALGRLFICPANDCYLDSDETWHYRDSFADHLRRDHHYTEDKVNEAVENSNRDWQYKA